MIKSVKLADIAAECNVSVVTVSKALSGQKGVSEEMREKIKQIADEMGYTPIHGTSKVKAKTYTIGVLSLENYFNQYSSFYWTMYQTLTKNAAKNNCFTMLEIVSYADENNVVMPKLMEEDRIDGLIVIGRPKKKYLKALYEWVKIPMVFLDFYDDEKKADCVISSSFYGAYEMTRYLIHKGHEQIAFVGTIGYTESITDRYLGYMKGLMEANIQVREDWLLKDRNPEDGIVGLAYQFELPQEMPTAFFCNNDITAYALIKTLRDRGYRIPEEISVASYDDYIYPEYGESMLTTYAVDMESMTNLALRCITKRIEHPERPVNTHVSMGKLIERSSVAVPKSK